MQVQRVPLFRRQLPRVNLARRLPHLGVIKEERGILLIIDFIGRAHIIKLVWVKEEHLVEAFAHVVPFALEVKQVACADVTPVLVKHTCDGVFAQRVERTVGHPCAIRNAELFGDLRLRLHAPVEGILRPHTPIVEVSSSDGGADVRVGGVEEAAVVGGGLDDARVEDDDLGDAGVVVAVFDDDAVVALVAEFLRADGAGVGGGAWGEAGIGGGLVGWVFEGDEDGIGVLSVSGGVLAVGGEVGALDVHGGSASGGVEGSDVGGGGVVPEDAGFAVLVEELGVDGFGVVLPVAEPCLEAGRAHLQPLPLGQLRRPPVRRLHPLVGVLVALADGLELVLGAFLG